MAEKDPTHKFRKARYKEKRNKNGEYRRQFWIKDAWRPRIQRLIDRIRVIEERNKINK